MKAMTEPNLGNIGFCIGPGNCEMRNCVNNIAAFQTVGPTRREIAAMQIRELEGSRSGNDFTNMYAATKSTVMKMERTSKNRNTSLEFPLSSHER